MNWDFVIGGIFGLSVGLCGLFIAHGISVWRMKRKWKKEAKNK